MELKNNHFFVAGNNNHAVNSAFFSRDGKSIITASDDSTVRLWSFKDKQEAKKVSFDSLNVIFSSFSPDGLQAVSVGDILIIDDDDDDRFGENGKSYISGVLFIWRVADGQILRRIITPNRHVSAFFSPDNRKIVTASKNGRAYVLETFTGKTLSVFSGHSDSLRSASFSPDGKVVITASEDRTVRVWCLESSKEVGLIDGHDDWVMWASFSPDKNFIAIASRSGNVIIFDYCQKKQTKVLRGHTNTINSALFSSDGRYIVTASSDFTARIWDVNSGKVLKIMNHSTFANFASFSPDNESVVVALNDGTACVWPDVFLSEKFDLVQMITRKKRLLPRCLMQLIGNRVME